jgi:hypothetical protein
MADWDPVVNEIFVRVIEAGSPAERAAVLDRCCRGEAELQRKVEALLTAQGDILIHGIGLGDLVSLLLARRSSARAQARR